VFIFGPYINGNTEKGDVTGEYKIGVGGIINAGLQKSS
jgi:hypothetical protein